VESNESTPEQLQLAAEQGKADGRALSWELRDAAPASGEMTAGEYRIAYVLTAPEGWYEPGPGGLVWKEPGDAGAHLRVFVLDGADGRTVPDLDIRASLLDGSGRAVDSRSLPFGWYPLLNGYGDNLRLPTDGSYTLRVEIAPPRFRRHDPYNGDRFTQPAVAEFSAVPFQGAGLSRRGPASARSEGQLELARGQGEALTRTLHAMWEQATSGAEQPAGDYRVAYAVEYSEAYWHYHGDHFQYATEYEESAAKNCHVEAAPLDARTGRFLPGLQVEATLVGKDGRTVGTRAEPFMWHPWLYHYGENWRVPESGEYRLRLRFAPPSYRRYGREAGRRFASPAEVEFTSVKIESGEK
jgi:uncharacterized protein involved in high-affinity Fe2+ transport